MKKKPGVYQVINVVTGKRYVGSSKNLVHRKAVHIYELRRGMNKNPNLQSDFNLYGEDSFEFSALEYIDDLNQLVDVEQKWIDFLHPEYNINQLAGNHIGEYIHTPEALAKRRETYRGKQVHSEEHKEELRQRWLGENNPNFGREYSEEERQIMSERLKGKNNPNFGKPRDEETRQKIGSANAKTYHGIVDPEGNVYDEVINISEFCREHDLNVYSMCRMLRGERNYYKGWRLLEQYG